MKNNKNWKTTTAGIVFAVGTALTTSDDPLLRSVGSVLVAASGLFGFFMSKDKDITDVGVNARREDM